MRDSLQLCAVVFLENGPLAIEVVHKRLLDLGGFRTPHMSRTKLPYRSTHYLSTCQATKSAHMQIDDDRNDNRNSKSDDGAIVWTIANILWSDDLSAL